MLLFNSMFLTNFIELLIKYFLYNSIFIKFNLLLLMFFFIVVVYSIIKDIGFYLINFF